MKHVKNSASACSGFTLIELIITIAVMGIVMATATFNFRAWQEKNWMEAQTREILTDLNDARTSAFTQKMYYGIIFEPNSYVMKSYSGATVPTTATASSSGTTVKSKSLKYGITKSGTSFASTPVLFDTTGMTYEWFTIFVTTDPGKEAASVNCITISTARVNMGKINGTACEFK
jgi:prepilin-type N-terminal cleavage/methylation domain-containing protein